MVNEKINQINSAKAKNEEKEEVIHGDANMLIKM